MTGTEISAGILLLIAVGIFAWSFFNRKKKNAVDHYMPGCNHKDIRKKFESRYTPPPVKRTKEEKTDVYKKAYTPKKPLKTSDSFEVDLDDVEDLVEDLLEGADPIEKDLYVSGSKLYPHQQQAMEDIASGTKAFRLHMDTSNITEMDRDYSSSSSSNSSDSYSGGGSDYSSSGCSSDSGCGGGSDD